MRLNSFNLGSSGQNPVDSYFLLEEVLRLDHKPKLLILETYWKALCGDDTDYISSSYIFLNMKWSRNKLGMFNSAFDFPASIKLFCKSFNNRRVLESSLSSIFNKYIKRFIHKHGSKDSEKQEKEIGKISIDRYVGKGYVENEGLVSKTELLNNELKNEVFKLNHYQLLYLEKTIDLAIQRVIKVILVSAPVPPTAFKDVYGYDEIYKRISKIAENREIEYLDYNIINNSLNIFTDEDFKDDDHLNKKGVIKLNDDLVKIISEKAF